MKDIFNNEKKLIKYFWIVILGICSVIAFYEISSDMGRFLGWLREFTSKAVKVVTPVIVGAVIAYLLHNPGKKLQALLSKAKFFKKHPARAKSLSVILTALIAMAFLVGFCFAIIPNTVESIGGLVSRLTDLREPLEKAIVRLSKNEIFIGIMGFFNVDITSSDPGTIVIDLINKGQKYFAAAGSYAYSFALDTGTFLYNFVIGFIISVYINLEWEALKLQVKRFSMAIFGRSYERLRYVAHLCDRTFSVYIYGKTLTSAIIVLMAIIACFIFAIPYAPMIGLILAITNLIPIAGPWLGGIICGVITLLAGVDKMIIVLIIAEGAQLFDNNFLTPKVVGDMVDLDGFWVFVSVIITGSIGGIFAMLIAIPLFSVIKTLIGEAVDIKLRKLDIADVPPADISES